MSVRSFQQIVNAQAGGHHPVHTGLQKHSVGGAYPLAPVAYETEYGLIWHIENLEDGTTAMCYGGPREWPAVGDALRFIDRILSGDTDALLSPLTWAKIVN